MGGYYENNIIEYKARSLWQNIYWKKYEYRKRFPKGKLKEYLYVNKPVQEIKDILYLDERCNLTETDMDEFLLKEINIGWRY